MQDELNEIRRIEISCDSKVKYDSKEKAEQAYKSYVINMKRDVRGRKTNKINHKQRPYKCDIRRCQQVFQRATLQQTTTRITCDSYCMCIRTEQLCHCHI